MSCQPIKYNFQENSLNFHRRDLKLNFSCDLSHKGFFEGLFGNRLCRLSRDKISLYPVVNWMQINPKYIQNIGSYLNYIQKRISGFL